LSGLVLLVGYILFLQPKSPHTRQFQAFRDANLFNYERAISQGDFRSVEADLQKNLDDPEHKLLWPEIEFAKKLVRAARLQCE
ncbi:MAG: hypothetical protein JNK89_00640, partial [Saprospiraceae bacterium]|nr:hypothetical protein [Saprospiraceae bacterium]